MTRFEKAAVVVAAMFAVAMPQPLRAADETTQACYSAEDLAGTPEEVRPVRRPHAYAPPDISLVRTAAELPEIRRGVIRRVALPAGEKLIALTFDLCEQPHEIAGYDGRIIDLLRREGVKATLFAGGKWMQTHAVRAEQLISDPLLEIANHSETHRNLRVTGEQERTKEILAPQRAYEALREKHAERQCVAGGMPSHGAIAPRLTLFRFPYGACNPEAVRAVNDAGLAIVQWDLSLGDPDPAVSAAAIARNLVANARPGSIVIGHANGRGWHTADALAVAIPKLKAMGFTFVTVSELLARGKPVVAQSCYNVRPGDTDRYDMLSALKGSKAGQWSTTVKKAKSARALGTAKVLTGTPRAAPPPATSAKAPKTSGRKTSTGRG